MLFSRSVCVFSCQTVKTREEKEVLEHFAGVVSTMYMYMYMYIYMYIHVRVVYIVIHMEIHVHVHVHDNTFLKKERCTLISHLKTCTITLHMYMYMYLSWVWSRPPAVHYDDCGNVQRDLQGDDCLPCGQDRVKLCAPDHPQLLPRQPHHLPSLRLHPAQLPAQPHGGDGRWAGQWVWSQGSEGVCIS